ncbi:putative oxidoreductase [Shimia sp. SK013]|uniref:SDR family NAD(P)-dependent oxidoreductase n=1 Tax=Shimia sp. SK013 TaxID=1389006 RepID=UPI0006CDE4BA|nr:SDR family NAD(P)-dependent oxidoreductase [Shimia sp. SK013]KPA19892.1 putative oxidoreductase [Shimia sp. SK013]
MIPISGKTYWLVGASEGLGRALARALAAEGAHLVLSARNVDRLDSLSADIPGSRVLAMDVTDAASVSNAIAAVGDIDGVIYNAGAYDPMNASEWDAEAALKMCDVNFLGAMRILGQIIPTFLNAGKGDVTLIGSLAAYRGLPNSIGYGASKAALRSVAETMRHDLAGSGIVVRLVNPGFIDTRLTQKNTFKMPMLMSPEKAAARVVGAMRKRRFRTDFPAPFSWLLRLYSVLPDFLVLRFK